jgi:SAM-dependent methyltransferase
MTSEAVRSYYASFGEREWTRLTTPIGEIEFAVNTHALAKHLPPDARVLDIGGGPGRYALWLAERGHRVTLADLSPELLAVARLKVAESPNGMLVEEIVEADACDLSRWDDHSFDAVLSLGPFYHLPDPVDRERAAGELSRVLRPGGIAFVAFVTRYCFLRRTMAIPDERHRLTQPEFVERLLEEGLFVNDIPGRFTHGYGAHPNEIAPFLQRYGFEMLELLASEGIAWGVQDALAEMSTEVPDAHQAALDVIISTASDQSILGMSDHLLYVGKKTRNVVGHAR